MISWCTFCGRVVLPLEGHSGIFDSIVPIEYSDEEFERFPFGEFHYSCLLQSKFGLEVACNTIQFLRNRGNRVGVSADFAVCFNSYSFRVIYSSGISVSVYPGSYYGHKNGRLYLRQKGIANLGGLSNAIDHDYAPLAAELEKQRAISVHRAFELASILDTIIDDEEVSMSRYIPPSEMDPEFKRSERFMEAERASMFEDRFTYYLDNIYSIPESAESLLNEISGGEFGKRIR